MSVIRLAMFALVLFVAPAAFAQEEAPDAGATGAEGPRSWLSPRKGFNSLTTNDGKGASSRGWGLGLFVLACAGGSVLLILKKRKVTPKSSNELHVLTSTRIGPKSQLVIAQVDGRRILLGVTDGSIQRLAWLKRKKTEAAITVAEAPEAAPVKPAGFAAVLNDAFASFRKKEQPSAAITLAAETEDKVQLRTARKEPELIRVEAQAAGLISRLKELQQ
jgi:flagellar biogenesis protein FliO